MSWALAITGAGALPRLAKARSRNLAIRRLRLRDELAPNTTPIRRRPSRLAEVTRLKPEARM